MRERTRALVHLSKFIQPGSEPLKAMDVILDRNRRRDEREPNQQGRILRTDRDPARAPEHFARAAELEPNEANHHNDAAAMLIDLGRLDEAEIALGRALALSPDHAFAGSNRSRLRERQKRYAEAVAALVRATQSGTTVPGADERMQRLRRLHAERSP